MEELTHNCDEYAQTFNEPDAVEWTGVTDELRMFLAATHVVRVVGVSELQQLPLYDPAGLSDASPTSLKLEVAVLVAPHTLFCLPCVPVFVCTVCACICLYRVPLSLQALVVMMRSKQLKICYYADSLHDSLSTSTIVVLVVHCLLHQQHCSLTALFRHCSLTTAL
jgi:hypothetical protein